MQTFISTLLNALRQGATVITPNNRLSNQLLHDYYHVYHAHGIPEKPRCLPYREFLKSLFANYCQQTPDQNHPLLLSSAQERHLWKGILHEQHLYAYHDGLLEEIQRTWTDCRHWQISLHDQAFAQTPQTHQFQQWQILFQTELDKLNAITEAQLIDYLLLHTMHLDHAMQKISIPSHLLWVCFDDLTPQQEALQQALATKGSLQEQHDLTEMPSERSHYKARDREDEWLKMVTWAKSRLDAGDERIALVIPDLQQVASTFQRFLKRHVADETYNISLGKNLLEYPLISHALEWLALNTTSLTHHQAQLLLRSPYLQASQQEFLARAQFMDEHSLMCEPLLNMDTLKATCRQKTPILAQLLDHIAEYPQRATGIEWVQHFKQRLSSLGFPGEYALESAAYQCFQRLMTLLDEFIELSMIHDILTADEALDVLHHLAQQTIFQIKQPQTPMVITGFLEASGCQANSIWVSGLTDQCLPQAVRLSAFIPHTLQRELAMPHAVTAHELHLAQQLIKRLQYSCQRIVFSYPSLTADQPNLPSPFITEYASWYPLEYQLEPDTCDLISLPETYQLPLIENEQIKGGTALLANQAKCPFKAFAAHRLNAKAAEPVVEGIDARERGQLTHKILEHLWQELKSQANLRALSFETLDERVTSIISKVLTSALKNKSLSYPLWLQSIEQERLKRLIHAALDWEKQRPDFVVEAIEQTCTLALGGLSFQIRMDRVDRVKTIDSDLFEDKLVIDYKTSLPSTKPWREERPEAPQLLLYALTDEHITTLLFAQLKAGQLTCQGFSHTALPLEGIQTLKKEESWSDFQAMWQQTLTALADEFQQGQCMPSPQRQSTCATCSFKNLCRVA